MPKYVYVEITPEMRDHVPAGRIMDGGTNFFWAVYCHDPACPRSSVGYYGDPEKPYASRWYCAEHLESYHSVLEERMQRLKPLRAPLVYPEAW